MDAFPLLPKTKPAWAACLFLIVALFLLYYSYLYQPLVEHYKLQNHVIRYTYKATESVTKRLEFDLITPKSFGGDTVPIVTISVHNPNPEFADLKLRLSWEPKNPVDNRNLAIISLTDTIQPTEAYIQVQPYSYAFVQLPLIFMGDSLDLEHELFILATVDGATTPERLSAETTEIHSVVNRIDSALYFILKNLLLPPLANGLLPALALMSCWFVEREEEGENITASKVLRIFLKAAIYAVGGIILFYLIETKDEKIYQPLLIILLLAVSVYILMNIRGFWRNRKHILKRLQLCGTELRCFISGTIRRINSFDRR